MMSLPRAGPIAACSAGWRVATFSDALAVLKAPCASGWAGSVLVYGGARVMAEGTIARRGSVCPVFQDRCDYGDTAKIVKWLVGLLRRHFDHMITTRLATAGLRWAIPEGELVAIAIGLVELDGHVLVGSTQCGTGKWRVAFWGQPCLHLTFSVAELELKARDATTRGTHTGHYRAALRTGWESAPDAAAAVLTLRTLITCMLRMPDAHSAQRAMAWQGRSR